MIDAIDVWIIVLLVYTFGLVISLVHGIADINFGTGKNDIRRGARLALISPVWFLVAPYWIVIGVRYLWRESEWGRR